MTILRIQRSVSLVPLLLLLTVARCKSDDDSGADKVGALPTYVQLFSKLPKAKVSTPAAALPHTLPWMAASPDAETWRAWVVQQPYAKKVMQTPMFAEFRLSREWRTLQSLHARSAQAAKLVGQDDRGTLWAGPTAIGIAESSDPRRSREVIVIKSIDATTQALVRFAAAFGLLSQSTDQGLELAQTEIHGVPVHTWTQDGRTISFALFSNLIIASDSSQLVKRATALAMGEALNEDDEGSGSRFPPPETPGVHVSIKFGNTNSMALWGLQETGLSLVADPAAPVVLRRNRKGSASDASLGLLKYAPESTFLAAVDGASPKGALLSTLKERLGGKLIIDDTDIEEKLLSKLDEGMAVIFTGAPQAHSPGAVVIFSHSSKDLEGPLTQVLKAMSNGSVERTKLNSNVKGTLIGPSGAGIHAALTEDALLLSMSQESLRAALAAGQAQAPSLTDRKLNLAAGANSAFYLDLESGAKFMSSFVGKHSPKKDAETQLAPTLSVVGTGGRVFGRLVSGSKGVEEGALRVLP